MASVVGADCSESARYRAIAMPKKYNISGVPRLPPAGESVLRRVLLLSLLGATLGPVLDHVHVVTGTTAYAHSNLFEQPWWVPLEFAAAAVIIGLSHPILDRMLGRRSGRGLDTMSLLAQLLALSAIWVGSALLNQTPLVDTVVLLIAALAVWWTFDRTPQGLLVAAGTGAWGCGVEWTFATLGLFHYVAPNMGRIASWLPFLYAAASVALGNVGRRLMRDSATTTKTAGRGR